ncbi:glycosyltransferase [bacterium]|nr:glycosyltransferase [bacterium]MBU1958933.1 glycosyltransferase [bacterium]
MLFIAYGCQNKAVWNALKLHVDFIESTGEAVSFMVDKRYYDSVKHDYADKAIYSYANTFDLMLQLIKIEDKKIFSPVMFTTLYSGIAKILKSKEIYYWVQGSVPEESFLRHQSKLKNRLLSAIEYGALSVSDKNILVSDEMQKHLEKKHNKSYENSIVVPCVSEFSYDGSPKEKDSFVYIGGMSAWQRVDLMLQMFNQIMKLKPNAHLYIATLEKEIATQYINEHLDKAYHENVKLLSISDRSQIAHFLSTKEYGFLIREDIVVNQVSSPIKLAEYLSCGVNVIISDAVKSYASHIENEGAGIAVKSDNEITKKLQNFTPSSDNAIKVYQKYFSTEQHTNSYIKLLNKDKVS